jgi:hypothetical protein
LQVLHVAPAARGVSPDEEGCVERGMMVLLLKQVHLQNEGGAGAVRFFEARDHGRVTYKLLKLII